MYHYTESGLPNVFLKNGYTAAIIGGEECTSIEDIDGLHQAIAESIIANKKSLSKSEFKFLRVELNLSQKVLGKRFGVSEQTIARYEKGQSVIPRTTDAALRSLYAESRYKNNPVSYFLDLLADVEARQAEEKILLQEIHNHWERVG
ncbi:helix-turn-helix domain-containing protein [Idiomarina sp. UBA4520]|jgi:transcriptional regulator with XRE-family HTH domain|uniref:helix-turn-helix domain-containing protein n=1 Tax=Idiomarina sp. UBA4520 TaxID=1946647 RepID=UPI000A4D020F|nr:helix-turn-helix domain-containing protein [Idiomarina sp. UBA4520]MBF38689.1 transcriptional regulator [Idiomarinaceae bacterium]|tara:strand:- start:4723 stop:5163 length:441 start_codon:yes stop_codon:yes gene_type:complete